MNTSEIEFPKIRFGKMVEMKTKSIQLGYCHSVAKKIPMEGYEVESCVELPIKDGDADYDAAKYLRTWVATREEAELWAREHLEKDCWGSISVIPYVLTPYREFPKIMHLDYTGRRTR